MPQIPRLLTEHQPATWLNRAGRVDRSACLTLSAAKLWRHLPDDAWHINPGQHHQQVGQVDRLATVTLTAHELWVMHRFESPRPLQGDLRTKKSNAMRGCTFNGRPWPTTRTTLPHSDLAAPLVNPNRGVGFCMRQKILGLPALWITSLTIQRLIQHAKLKQHFLICPVCGDQRGTGIPACRSAQPNAADKHGGASPPAKHKVPKPKALPPGRTTKLYLPLCTEREWEDAQRAYLWLSTHTNPNAPLSLPAVGLIERYAELFPDRQLRCRQCLGLRYGEVK